MAAARQRAPAVAAPGAARVAFTGVLAVPDDFGRLRVVLVDRLAGGAPDGSAAALARALPRRGPGFSVPYELAADAAGGTRGVAWVTVPARHRAHWGAEAERLRGREVRVEATVRPFRTAAAHGVALDLAALEPI